MQFCSKPLFHVLACLDHHTVFVKQHFAFFNVEGTVVLWWTLRERFQHTRFSSLQKEASVTLKLKNGVYFMNKIKYPGHVIHLDWLEAASYTKKTIPNFAVSTAQIKLQFLTSFWNLLCRVGAWFSLHLIFFIGKTAQNVDRRAATTKWWRTESN